MVVFRAYIYTFCFYIRWFNVLIYKGSENNKAN